MSGVPENITGSPGSVGSGLPRSSADNSVDITEIKRLGIDSGIVDLAKELNPGEFGKIFCEGNIKILENNIDSSGVKRLQLISLFLRINLPSKGRSSEASALLAKVHKMLGEKNEKIIPVIQENIDFKESIRAQMAQSSKDDESSGIGDNQIDALGEEILKRISKSEGKWKSEDWAKERGKLSRPGFADCQVDRSNEPYVKDRVIEKQGPEKVGETTLVVDQSEIRDVREADIDHMDPWSQIIDRVDSFLSFVNGLGDEAIKAIESQLSVQYPGCFKIDGDGKLIGTKYLSVSLYNYSSNLSLMACFNNTQKSGDEASSWLLRVLGPNLFKFALRAPGTSFVDDDALLKCVLDQTGFIVCISNDENLIDQQFLGKGLADLYLAYTTHQSRGYIGGVRITRVEYQKILDLVQCFLLQDLLKLMRKKLKNRGII